MFKCINCKKEITEKGNIGTKNRNHCPHCLYSQHLDENIPGDRKSNCMGVMIPIALTFKKEKIDKYGKSKKGEIMIVHQCEKCKAISVNRIAGDDDPDVIMHVFEKSLNNTINNYQVLTEEHREELQKQLFGS